MFFSEKIEKKCVVPLEPPNENGRAIDFDHFS
jgi:hypothetical protein